MSEITFAEVRVLALGILAKAFKESGDVPMHVVQAALAIVLSNDPGKQ